MQVMSNCCCIATWHYCLKWEMAQPRLPAYCLCTVRKEQSAFYFLMLLHIVKSITARTFISPFLAKTSALLGDDLSTYEPELSIIWSFSPFFFFFFYCIMSLMPNESKCPCCACKISSCGLMVIIALPHRVWRKKGKKKKKPSLPIYSLCFLLFSMPYAVWLFVSKFWCYVCNLLTPKVVQVVVLEIFLCIILQNCKYSVRVCVFAVVVVTRGRNGVWIG